MLEIHPKKMFSQETSSLILDYSVQHKQASKIIQRYWHILKNDKEKYYQNDQISYIRRHRPSETWQ